MPTFIHSLLNAVTGSIMLLCGAGKSLVGITAASHIAKSILCLVPSDNLPFASCRRHPCASLGAKLLVVITAALRIK